MLKQREEPIFDKNQRKQYISTMPQIQEMKNKKKSET